MSKSGEKQNTRVRLWEGLYRILLCALMGIAISRWPFHPAEQIAILAAYWLLLGILHRIYLACNVGQSRVLELLLSQSLSNLIALLATAAALSLYLHALVPVKPLVWTFLTQEILSVVWSSTANQAYFRHYSPPRTIIVYQDEATRCQLYATPFFERKYNVIKAVRAGGMDVNALLSELNGCEVVFVADVSANMANGIAKYCAETGVKGFFMPRLGHIVLSGAAYEPNFSLPMLCVQRGGRTTSYLFVKRVMDVTVALVGIIVTLPVMLLTALAIYLDDRGPILYRQTRLTRDGRPFSILKFRSMRTDAERDGVARLAGQNDSRITRVGRFIRACRIDELPQLFNILMGDMSLVGPRPERPEIMRQYEREIPEFGLRLQVKAGLTGMAQVYGRYNTEPYCKLQMDLMYINEMSFLKDLYLLLATVKTVFMKDSTQGVAGEGETPLRTMPSSTHSQSVS